MDELIIYFGINIVFSIIISYEIYNHCLHSWDGFDSGDYYWYLIGFIVFAAVIFIIETVSFFGSVEVDDATKSGAIALFIFLSFPKIMKIKSKINTSLSEKKFASINRKHAKEMKKQKQYHSQIENAFIAFASKNNGIIMKKELTEIFGNKYPNKDLLIAIELMREEGMVEVQGDSYVFTTLI